MIRRRTLRSGFAPARHRTHRTHRTRGAHRGHRAHRSAAVALAAGVAASGLLVAAPAAPVAAAPRYTSYQPCPPPQPLLRGTHWSTHRLARGVTLREGVHDDRTVSGSPGAVAMHVLRVNLAISTVSTRPLVDHVAERQPLSTLAADRPQLVAATNTGFFDFYSGAPSGPVFTGGKPLVMSTAHEPVIGFTVAGLPQSADVWLDGRLATGRTAHQLQSINSLQPHRGISIYTPAWGRIIEVPLPAGRQSVLRELRGGRIVGGVMHGNHRALPNADLLVASTTTAERWLRGLRVGTRVRTTLRIRTTSRRPLVAGYNVGKRLVRQGKPMADLGCHERDTQAARTGVGISKDGKSLIIAVVADHPCYSRIGGCAGRHVHGLDHKEMARLMIDLGARSAWQWDGSGTSELIARMPRSHRLAIRNYCSDGQERPMPVGFGIFVRHHHRHRHHA